MCVVACGCVRLGAVVRGVRGCALCGVVEFGCVAACGPARLCAAALGSLWLRVVACGSVWLRVVVRGHSEDARACVDMPVYVLAGGVDTSLDCANCWKSITVCKETFFRRAAHRTSVGQPALVAHTGNACYGGQTGMMGLADFAIVANWGNFPTGRPEGRALPTMHWLRRKACTVWRPEDESCRARIRCISDTDRPVDHT